MSIFARAMLEILRKQSYGTHSFFAVAWGRMRTNTCGGAAECQTIRKGVSIDSGEEAKGGLNIPENRDPFFWKNCGRNLPSGPSSLFRTEQYILVAVETWPFRVIMG